MALVRDGKHQIITQAGGGRLGGAEGTATDDWNASALARTSPDPARGLPVS